jgi:hypothetical protein
MENNNITQRLSNMIETASDKTTSTFSVGTTESTGILDSIKNLSITTWVIIILIFSFLGFNIFSYLEKGTETAGSIIKPILSFISSTIGTASSQLTDFTAEGAKSVTNTVASNVNENVNQTQSIINSNSSTSIKNVANVDVSNNPSKNAVNLDVSQSNTLNKALNTSASTRQGADTGNYQEDDTSSNIQSGNSKSGWCYIGEDRGFRSCSQVGPSDECMSGDIFPSNEICMNPSLRA